MSEAHCNYARSRWLALGLTIVTLCSSTIAQDAPAPPPDLEKLLGTVSQSVATAKDLDPKLRREWLAGTLLQLKVVVAAFESQKPTLYRNITSYSDNDAINQVFMSLGSAIWGLEDIFGTLRSDSELDDDKIGIARTQLSLAEAANLLKYVRERWRKKKSLEKK
jgi:hypothetical protein